MDSIAPSEDRHLPRGEWRLQGGSRSPSAIHLAAETAATTVSAGPASPAFPDWLGVAVNVDVANAIDAFLHRFRGVFVFLLHRFEERPKERQIGRASCRERV